MPAAQAHQSIVIGTGKDNPTRLSACDWNNVYCDNPGCYRKGAALSGAWSVRVAQAGTYRFSLRRWPRESGLKLADGAPPLKGVDGGLMAGKALPISGARIRIDSRAPRISATKQIPKESDAAMFEVALASGDMKLQTWFLDDNGKELCGAYYVWVERLEESDDGK